MRYLAIITAALGLVLAAPASAAIVKPAAAAAVVAAPVVAGTSAKTAPVAAPVAAPVVKTAPVVAVAAPVPLPAAVVAEAGILPTSPLSFIDKALDSLSIAIAITPAAKADAALKVANENAAEAAVMSAAGDVALTTKSLAAVDTALATAVTSASKVTAPAAAAVVQQQVTDSTLAAKNTLDLGVASAPLDVKQQIADVVAPTVDRLVSAPSDVAANSGSVLPAGVCDPKKFAGCVQDNGCTLGTSQKCFLACPPKSVPCLKTASGKTCSVPDTDCVNQCLQKIAGCTESCLAQSDCKKTEVSTSTLQIIAPEELQKSFQLQLQSGAGGK